jgi:hypothetical protein
MELGKPIRTLVVEPVKDPRQETVVKRPRQPCTLPTTPSR